MGAIFNAYKLRTHPDFIGVVQTAAIKTATDIFVEAETVPNHAQRLSLARILLFEDEASRAHYMATFAFLCAADTAIRTAGYVGGAVNAEAIPDAVLLTVVQNAWLALAGNRTL